MRCLFCGKEILETASEEEKSCLWHKRCIKTFFGTGKMPKLELSDEQLEALTKTSVNKGLAVPGVQKKLSLHLSTDVDVRLTIVDYPTGYILKPQTEEYESLPEFEHLAMRLADTAGIKTVHNALIRINDEYAYITKRIDRKLISFGHTEMYGMEDFCQLAERLTADKYKGSYEKCSKIIKEYSSMSGIDMAEMFIRIVFSYVIGNSDMHLKNFSLIESEPGNRIYSLSAAYDILPVNVVLPEDKEQLALTMNGKKSNFHTNDFIEFAGKCDIREKAAHKMIDKICSCKEKYFELCDESYLSEEKKDAVKELIASRIDRLVEIE